MKTTILFVMVIIACFAGTAQAQDAFTPSWSAGFDFRGALPMGDFADFVDFGVGGTGNVAYAVAPTVSITGRVGYLYFGGKELPFSAGTTTGTVKINTSTIPILAGVKVFFGEGDMRMYGAGEVGMYMSSGSGDFTPTGGGAVTSVDVDGESNFGVSPSLGAQFKAGDKMNVDAHANFTNVFTEGSSTNWITFAIGFEWVLN